MCAKCRSTSHASTPMHASHAAAMSSGRAAAPREAMRVRLRRVRMPPRDERRDQRGQHGRAHTRDQRHLRFRHAGGECGDRTGGGERHDEEDPSELNVGRRTTGQHRDERERSTETSTPDRQRQRNQRKEHRDEDGDLLRCGWAGGDCHDREVHRRSIASARRRDAARRSSVSRTCRFCARSHGSSSQSQSSLARPSRSYASRRLPRPIASRRMRILPFSSATSPRSRR